MTQVSGSYAVGLQYAIKKYWKGKMYCLPYQSRTWYGNITFPRPCQFI